jgi:hypothetical protein
MVKHYEKIQAVILCLVLIISGLFIIPSSIGATNTGGVDLALGARADLNSRYFSI